MQQIDLIGMLLGTPISNMKYQGLNALHMPKGIGLVLALGTPAASHTSNKTALLCYC